MAVVFFKVVKAVKAFWLGFTLVIIWSIINLIVFEKSILFSIMIAGHLDEQTIRLSNSTFVT